MASETSPDGRLFYFAYGSNMCVERLRYRVPGCVPLATGKLTGYQLRFHKRSDDGSAKCDAFHTGDAEDFVLGRVFVIPTAERARLDDAEGLGKGYGELWADVVAADDATTYRALLYTAQASHIDASLTPYTWYKDFVVSGARDLDPEYVARWITSVPANPDPIPDRDRRRRAEVAPA